MRFERPKRLQYKNNPLAQVSCEVRFPPLLKLVQYGPVDFQSTLSTDYPLLEVINTGTIKLQNEVAPTPEVSAFQRQYQFKSSDQLWTVTISPSAVVFTANKYTKWQDFRERVEQILKGFISVYSPARCTRVGLRYIDVIDSAKLGLDGMKRSEWLNPALLGLLDEQFSPVQEMQTFSLIKLEPQGSLGLRWGLGIQVMPDSQLNKVYVLDGDFFYEDSPMEFSDTANIFKLLDDFNYQAGGLFQWAFNETLRGKLDPVELV